MSQPNIFKIKFWFYMISFV